MGLALPCLCELAAWTFKVFRPVTGLWQLFESQHQRAREWIWQ